MGGETRLEGAIDAMGKEREEQALEHIDRFTEEVVVVVRRLLNVVERFACDDYDQLEASAQERALSIVRRIAPRRWSSTACPSGGGFPMNRADADRCSQNAEPSRHIALDYIENE